LSAGGVAALPIAESIVPKAKPMQKPVMDDLDAMLEDLDLEGGSGDDLDDLLDEIGLP